MKIVLFSLFCLILIGITSYSYGFLYHTDLLTPDEKTKLPQVMLQLELRDSNGGLIAYIEADQIIGIAPPELNRFLDNLNNTSKEFFIKDDKKYESQQWEVNTETFGIELAYSGTRLMDIYQNDIIPLLIIRHDSFQTQPGDTLRLFWTVTRSVS